VTETQKYYDESNENKIRNQELPDSINRASYQKLETLAYPSNHI
jgi:hypothetical protein